MKRVTATRHYLLPAEPPLLGSPASSALRLFDGADSDLTASTIEDYFRSNFRQGETMRARQDRICQVHLQLCYAGCCLGSKGVQQSRVPVATVVASNQVRSLHLSETIEGFVLKFKASRNNSKHGPREGA